MVTVGVACRDQRRLTGNGSALEVVFHDDALYFNMNSIAKNINSLSSLDPTPGIYVIQE